MEWTLRMIHKARLRTAPVCDKVNICRVTAAWCDGANVSPHCTAWKRNKDKMRFVFPCVIPRPEGAKIWLAQLNTWMRTIGDNVLHEPGFPIEVCVLTTEKGDCSCKMSWENTLSCMWKGNFNSNRKRDRKNLSLLGGLSYPMGWCPLPWVVVSWSEGATAFRKEQPEYRRINNMVKTQEHVKSWGNEGGLEFSVFPWHYFL